MSIVCWAITVVPCMQLVFPGRAFSMSTCCTLEFMNRLEINTGYEKIGYVQLSPSMYTWSNVID